MNTGIPIIFIHYGDTPYLRYTLDMAQRNNPDKEVVLLGDEKNEKYSRTLHIRHIPFINYEQSADLQTFRKNFIYIGGANRQTEQDARFELFCHVRWFYLYEFMKEHKLDKCWYFDSDTLILEPLDKREEQKFEAYDITEQSNGSMMKGLIQFRQLELFVQTMNKLFADTRYADAQREEITCNPDWALCDMRAYAAFKNIYTPRTILLNEIIDHEMHDECICEDDGMETEYVPRLKRTIKKLYFSDRHIYEKVAATGEMVKLNSINMSWVTTALIEKVYYYKVHGTFPPTYLALFGMMKRLPRFIRTQITKETK